MTNNAQRAGAPLQRVRRRRPYQEGNWFAVPLTAGGYAVGICARIPRNSKAIFGYFFGPARVDIPGLAEVSKYRPADAMWVVRFGDTGGDINTERLIAVEGQLTAIAASMGGTYVAYERDVAWR